MKNSIYDLYLKDNIINKCETFFNIYLEQEGVPHKGLSDKEREAASDQLDIILNMILEIQSENVDEKEATGIIVDKLVALCVISKMNEAILCRLLDEVNDKLRDK